MAGVSTNASGARDFHAFVKCAGNRIIAPADIPGLISSSKFRDPTGWWANTARAICNRWLITFATRVADISGVRSYVAAVATADPTFQSGYRYAHSLYVDSIMGGTATLEHPDFFTVTQGARRYLKLSLTSRIRTWYSTSRTQ
ncbi:Sucrose hydrolase-like protein [Leptomonas seymouri]|uniref:Sucrose hydrolase-like protein n=1 Tax=Leptomonas seymouri TaxID=5684 RepID=A0A0N1PD60_LEPSE|nr:Sucrose hydrolase-like protein [Leptomonas seymouri]|eukprot:KPI88548.1 Sucrose hydrolase-like protein [Leptomonas seymouri]